MWVYPRLPFYIDWQIQVCDHSCEMIVCKVVHASLQRWNVGSVKGRA